MEVGWVWNRSLDKLVDLDEDLILEDLEDIDDMPKKVNLLPRKDGFPGTLEFQYIPKLKYWTKAILDQGSKLI